MTPTPGHWWARMATAIWLGVAAMLGAARLASAHGFDPVLLDITEGEGGRYAVLWKRRPGPAALLPRFPAHCAPVGEPPRAVTSDPTPQYWQLACGAPGLGGATLTVDGLESRADVVVRVAWRDGRTTSGVLRFDTPTLVLPTGPASDRWAVLRSYLGLGIEHILLGLDHLLFVLGLLLLADGWGTLLRTITAFTAAHSLTLALAAFGVLALPPAPVDATIALSIVVLAIELLREPGAAPTLARRAPWVVAFAFGLLHGLGFAGALAAVGLPPDHIPLALVAFNLGVELGQLVFVAAVLPAVGMAQRLGARRPLLGRVPAYAIGALAVAWTLERILAFGAAPS